ncbi:MAG: hypothetical protein A2103_00675 [Gammaproteobacteria bacterium GWF2_41_13]|nr:MAG: hypothetical protein A2103_00675 [Gammaproteobacteria bacterium GWF2_41_13]
MQVFYDFIPIIVFFVIYKLAGIYAATIAAMIISFLQMMIYRYRYKKFEPLQVITCLVILLLGSATIFSRNPLFIKWKPTIVNWFFAAIFLGTQLWAEKPMIQHMMGKKLTLPHLVWRRVNTSWCLFFFLTGMLNLYVVYHYSTSVWVDFKLFGLLSLTFLFALGQAVYLSSFLNANSE